MIRVSVTLISANDGTHTELARMDICNDDTGGVISRNYTATSYIGRDKKRLDKGTVSKRGRVLNWESERFHVWNLVRAALQAIGYNEGRAQHATPQNEPQAVLRLLQALRDSDHAKQNGHSPIFDAAIQLIEKA